MWPIITSVFRNTHTHSSNYHAQVVHQTGPMLPDLRRCAAEWLHSNLLTAVQFPHGAHHHMHRVKHQRWRELRKPERWNMRARGSVDWTVKAQYEKRIDVGYEQTNREPAQMDTSIPIKYKQKTSWMPLTAPWISTREKNSSLENKQNCKDYFQMFIHE